MGPAPNSRIDHTTRKEDFTQNLIHESQTSITICYAFKMLKLVIVSSNHYKPKTEKTERNRGLKEKNEKKEISS